MDKYSKLIVIFFVLLAAAFAGAIWQNYRAGSIFDANSAISIEGDLVVVKGDISEPKGLPRLVEFGSDKCVPCRLMAPVLNELKREYDGVFSVTSIDVMENKDTAVKLGIRAIPTQIFLDASGRELYRHTGYFAKHAILAKWKQLGVDVDKARPGSAGK